MDFRTLQIFPQPRKKHFHLLLPPPLNFNQKAESYGLKSVQILHQLVAAGLLGVFVFRPGIYWEFELSFLDVNEAGLLDQLLQTFRYGDGKADFVASFNNLCLKLCEMRVCWDGIIIGARRNVCLFRFEPGAGFQVAVKLSTYKVQAGKKLLRTYS